MRLDPRSVLALALLASARTAAAQDGLPAEIPVRLAKDQEPAAKLSPALRAALAASNDGPLTFMLDLREQVDLEQMAAALEGAARQPRRAWVARALKTIATRSQQRLRPLLEKLQRERRIDSWTAVSIVNRLLVRGRPSAVDSLARSREVASLEGEIVFEGSPQQAPAPGDVGVGSSWALEAMAVARAWESGIDGTGVIVGLIDSGASAEHEQLHDNFRGGPQSWFDPLHGTARPSDVQLGHGTAVLSCAVGQARKNGLRGVAPGARWIAAVGLDEGRYNNVLLSRAADWMIEIGQPDVLIVPWRIPGDRCDRSMKPMLNAWRAAGMIVVFAAGNGGPGSASDVPPANSSGIFPGSGSALSVGAVDSALQIHVYSSRGPNSCGDGLFPQLVAPGAGVMVAMPAASSLYREVSGTSFAAGYVAGVAALLLQRCPRAQVVQIERALREGALDLGPPGPDTTYGHGLVNARRALEALKGQPGCP